MKNKIFKTGQKNTYFKGSFCLRNKNENWAHPIDFPTVFVAFGAAIRSGNWQSCTAIDTTKYVIDNYFAGAGKNEGEKLFSLWELCEKLSAVDWAMVESNIACVEDLIEKANLELLKLPKL